MQGIGAVLIEKIDGCYSNVIGLPLFNLYKNLNKIGVDIFK
ncbi:MAG: Maf family protein [Candidatus Paceibacteria bacterium]